GGNYLNRSGQVITFSDPGIGRKDTYPLGLCKCPSDYLLRCRAFRHLHYTSANLSPPPRSLPEDFTSLFVSQGARAHRNIDRGEGCWFDSGGFAAPHRRPSRKICAMEATPPASKSVSTDKSTFLIAAPASASWASTCSRKPAECL